MNSVERVKALCKKKKVPISKLERDLGYSNGYIGQLRKGVFPSDRLQEIAYYFKVPIEYLFGKEGCTKCPVCGLEYDASNLDDCYVHEENHGAFINATKKFGLIYSSNEYEAVKNKFLKIVIDNSKSTSDKVTAWIEIMRAYWSRSLCGCSYNLSHPDFDTYASMLLNQPSFSKRIDNDEVYSKLVSMYGTSPGIENGRTYYKHFKSLESSETLFKTFEQLNKNNQQKAITYTNKLLEIQQLENTSFDVTLNAAHDEGATEEQKIHADKIMDDDSEWE